MWPLLLALLLARTAAAANRRAALRRVLVCCVVGALASAVLLAMAYDAMDPGRAYYGTDTRAASLLIGAGLAVVLARHRPRDAGWVPSPTVRRVLGVLAAGAVLVLAWAWTHADGGDSWLYRGGLAGLAVAVAVVLAHVDAGAAWLAGSAAGPRPAGAPRPDLVRRVPLALAGLHRGQRGSDRDAGCGAVRAALPDHPHAGDALLRAGRAARPEPRCRVASPRPPPSRRPGGRGGAGQCRRGRDPGAGDHRRAVAALRHGWPRAAAGLRPRRHQHGRGADRRRRRARPRARVPPPARHDRQRPRPPPATRTHAGRRRVRGLDRVDAGVGPPSHPALDVRDRTMLGCGVARTGPYRYFGQLYEGVSRDCRDWPRLWRRAIAADDPDVALIVVGRWETMDRMHDGRWSHVGEAALRRLPPLGARAGHRDRRRPRRPGAAGHGALQPTRRAARRQPVPRGPPGPRAGLEHAAPGGGRRSPRRRHRGPRRPGLAGRGVHVDGRRSPDQVRRSAPHAVGRPAVDRSVAVPAAARRRARARSSLNGRLGGRGARPPDRRRRRPPVRVRGP